MMDTSGRFPATRPSLPSPEVPPMNVSSALLRKALFGCALSATALSTLGLAGRADAAGPSLSGRVIDDATGVPLVGATVVASDALLDGAPNKAQAVATTDATGSFVLTGLPSDPKFFVQIFAADTHAAVRRTVDATSASADLALVRVVMPTATEQSWLDLMNGQRKKYGLSPLRFEDSALRAARRWAQFQSQHNVLEHEVPGATDASGISLATPVDRYRNHGGPSDEVGLAENIAQLGVGSFAEAQRLWFDERRACGTTPVAGCTNEGAGHFLNIVDPKARFVGLGMASGKGGSFYDALFVDSADEARS